MTMSEAQKMLRDLSQAKVDMVEEDNIKNIAKIKKYRIECIEALHQYLDSLPGVTLEELKYYAKTTGKFRYDYLAFTFGKNKYYWEFKIKGDVILTNYKSGSDNILCNGQVFKLNDNINKEDILTVSENAIGYDVNISVYYLITYLQNKINIEGLGKPRYEHTNYNLTYRLYYIW